jgi:hypothetical protein
MQNIPWTRTYGIVDGNNVIFVSFLIFFISLLLEQIKGQIK